MAGLALLLERRKKVFFWLMFVRMLYFDPGFMGWVFKFIVLFVAFSKNISPSAERGMKTEERKEGKRAKKKIRRCLR